MNIKKFLIKESVFIVSMLSCGAAVSYGIVMMLNYFDRSSWTWHFTPDLAAWFGGVFLVCGYVLRLLGKTLRLIVGAVIVTAFVIYLIFIFSNMN